MKLLNEHWNGFRSSQSLVDAYKTLYRSLGLQIKIVASCSHSATGLCRCLASGGAWSSPEHPPADPFPRETGLHQALLSCLGVLLISRAEPELSPSPESSVSPEGFSPSRFCLSSGDAPSTSEPGSGNSWFELASLLEKGISSTDLCA